MVMSRDRVFEALHDAGVNEDVATWMADQLERDRSARLTRADLDTALALFRLEVKSDIDAAKELLTAEMDGAVKVLDQRIIGLDQRITVLDRDVSSLRDEVKELRDEVKELREDLSALRSEVNDLEKSLRAEMAEMEMRLRGEMVEMDKSLRAEMAEMERRLRGEIQELAAKMYLEINGVRSEQRWFFGIVAALIAALIGVVAARGG